MNLQFLFRINWNVVIALLAVIGAGTSSCAKKISFKESSDVPGAEGTVKIKSKESNYVIDISTLNLAPSDKLSPSKKMYVVWADKKTMESKTSVL